MDDAGNKEQILQEVREKWQRNWDKLVTQMGKDLPRYPTLNLIYPRYASKICVVVFTGRSNPETHRPSGSSLTDLKNLFLVLASHFKAENVTTSLPYSFS